MKYYLIAGERSGDLHGGNLIKALKDFDKEASFRGFGGDEMQGQGMSLAVHYRQLAFMGFLEVIKNLRTISGYLKQCKQDILEFKPDVVILIDYGGFNMKIAKFCHEKGIRVFYYISPKVWAWNTKRAYKLKKFVDRMFVILPFEKDFFKKFDWEVDYVGNPVLDAVKGHATKKLAANGEKVVALLPGSRKQELQKSLPIFKQVIEHNRHYTFVLAAVDSVDQDVYREIASLDNVQLVFDRTYDFLAEANAAIVTSGTATLETALWKVPQVVTYRTSGISYSIAKSLIKVDFISLVNLIAGKEVVKELIQAEFNPARLLSELKLLLEDDQYRKTMLASYDEIYQTLDIGSARENAAKLMVKYLTKE